MADVFEHIIGQPRVRDYLRTCIQQDKASQASLFTGPLGSNKTQAAFCFAAALLCQDGGCDVCETCERVLRRKHPDVHYLEPEGANGYVVDQIRAVIADVQLAPIAAACKVYIINRCDLLGISAANSFLKTLEEPPENVYFVLMARTQDSVLPTILSRCQVVPFRHIPPDEAAGFVSQYAGVDDRFAAIAIAAAGGSIHGAVDFCRSTERKELRRSMLDTLAQMEHASEWDVLSASKDLTLACKAPLDAVRIQQEEELAAASDWLTKTAQKSIEQRNKRELSAKSIELFRQLTAVAKSWLRDVLMVQAGQDDLTVNDDASDSIRRLASCVDEARIVSACQCLDKYDATIAYNVSAQTCMDAMLLELKTILYSRT